MRTLVELRYEASVRYSVPEELVFGRTREQGPIAARHWVWRQLREQGWSPQMIGKATGFDRTTVISALGMLSDPAAKRGSLRRCLADALRVRAANIEHRSELAAAELRAAAAAIEAGTELADRGHTPPRQTTGDASVAIDAGGLDSESESAKGSGLRDRREAESRWSTRADRRSGSEADAEKAATKRAKRSAVEEGNHATGNRSEAPQSFLSSEFDAKRGVVAA